MHVNGIKYKRGGPFKGIEAAKKLKQFVVSFSNVSTFNGEGIEEINNFLLDFNCSVLQISVEDTGVRREIWAILRWND